MSYEKETSELRIPGISEITRNYQKIAPFLKKTPVILWEGEEKEKLLGKDARVWIKLELLQHAGSFKPRGGLTVSQSLSKEDMARGLITVSAGNHGISTAWIAKRLGIKASVYLPASANPFRVQRIKELGATTYIAENIHKAFENAEEDVSKNGGFFFHPFEGYGMTLGHGSLALELVEQIPAGFDQVVLPIGGGGLCGGVAAGLKQHPATKSVRILGVEPEGADAMNRSFCENQTVRLEKVNTIADSLSSPRTLPYSLHVCRKFVDQLGLIADDDMLKAMKLIFSEFRMLVEPACSSGFASMLRHPGEYRGKSTVLLFCGSNMDQKTWMNLTDEPGSGK